MAQIVESVMFSQQGSCASLQLGAEALNMNCLSPQEQPVDIDAAIAAPHLIVCNSFFLGGKLVATLQVLNHKCFYIYHFSIKPATHHKAAEQRLATLHSTLGLAVDGVQRPLSEIPQGKAGSTPRKFIVVECIQKDLWYKKDSGSIISFKKQHPI